MPGMIDQCLAKAIAVDIPDTEALRHVQPPRRLRQGAGGEAADHRQEAPARTQQVINAAQKMCPDVETMF